MNYGLHFELIKFSESHL